MSTLGELLIRKAFVAKYGYSPDFSYDEIVSEFQRRYDQAQVIRLQNKGSHRIMMIIEGMSEDLDHGEAFLEREVRKDKLEHLTKGSGFGATEIDRMIEDFAQRLEAEWIQKEW